MARFKCSFVAALLAAVALLCVRAAAAAPAALRARR
jgi:hypothetical protein